MSRRLAALAGVLLLVGGAAAAPPFGPRAAAEGTAAAPATTGADARAVLERAVAAAGSLAYRGRLTVVGFTAEGPTIASGTQTRGGRGLLLAGDGRELGRVDGQGFLRSATGLVTVSGVEATRVRLDRLARRYEARLGQVVDLDTGPAQAVALHRRHDGALRERWYGDLDTGLIVRRETFASNGRPVRLMAFTELEPGVQEFALPVLDGHEADGGALTPDSVTRLRAAGFTVPAVLPGGFELQRALEVPGAGVATAHLVYDDGLYTVSVFQQLGRLDRALLAGARRLEGEDAVRWSWSDAGPRRLVWHGAGTTFSAYSDAASDDLQAAVAGLPADPAPGLLARLGRGLGRLGGLLVPG